MKIDRDGGDGAGLSTRHQVARLILESGPLTAATLADRLALSTAAVRRHLDALVGDGLLAEREARPALHRGRGRPARAYALTDAGRSSFPHAYDDLATTALRYLRAEGGEAAVVAFAEHRARGLEATLVADRGGNPPAAEARAAHVRPAQARPAQARPAERRPVSGRPAGRLSPERLAGALSAAGYSATTQTASAGVQICQHHCPVAHVAAEFPELCEAETRAFERILGTYVQRLATIAHGDGVCTTHVPTAHVPTAHVPTAHIPTAHIPTPPLVSAGGSLDRGKAS